MDEGGGDQEAGAEAQEDGEQQIDAPASVGRRVRGAAAGSDDVDVDDAAAAPLVEFAEDFQRQQAGQQTQRHQEDQRADFAHQQSLAHLRRHTPTHTHTPTHCVFVGSTETAATRSWRRPVRDDQDD